MWCLGSSNAGTGSELGESLNIGRTKSTAKNGCATKADRIVDQVGKSVKRGKNDQRGIVEEESFQCLVDRISAEMLALQNAILRDMAGAVGQEKISGVIHRKEWWHPNFGNLQISLSACKGYSYANDYLTSHTLERTSLAAEKSRCLPPCWPALTEQLLHDTHPSSSRLARILPRAFDISRISLLGHIVSRSCASPSLEVMHIARQQDKSRVLRLLSPENALQWASPSTQKGANVDSLFVKFIEEAAPLGEEPTI